MPEAIAHYKILEPLGRGGLGEVYRARDTALGRTVAIKVLPDTITRDPARMQLLTELVARLVAVSHPNIAMLFEMGRDGSRQFLVFEFVQGEPLTALVKGRALNVRRAIDFAINLADALADAHGADLIHGDIRPETIMITPKDRAKLLNFGLSAFTGGSVNHEVAIAYLSPEEIAGQPADSRSDIYSLGAVMFEMLTGRQRARGLVLSGLNPLVPPELEQLIAKMLAANVDSRAQSAAAISAELRSIAAIVDTRTEAAEALGVEPLRHREPRRPIALIVLIVVVLAAAVAAWLMTR